MTQPESFEIFFREGTDTSIYRMQVAIIYKTEKVLGFKVTGGKRRIVMEKLLTGKKGKWKIIDGDIDPRGDIQKTAYGLMGIQNAIDEYLKKNDS